MPSKGILPKDWSGEPSGLKRTTPFELKTLASSLPMILPSGCTFKTRAFSRERNNCEPLDPVKKIGEGKSVCPESSVNRARRREFSNIEIYGVAGGLQIPAGDD